MDAFYNYQGLEASLYDELDELSDFGDYDFYRWLVENGEGPVLDVGCGTGRILLPMARDGIVIDGLESSAEMVQICRDKIAADDLNASVYERDMRSFSIDRKYGMILIPGFTIQLLSHKDAVASLICCRNHLLEGGQLVVSSFIPWEMIDDGREKSEWYDRKEYRSEGGHLSAKASQAWELDRMNESLLLKNRYERFDSESGAVIDSQETSMSLRWRLPYDFMTLMQEAGFESPEIYGEFELEECDPDAESLVCVGRLE